MQKLLPEAIVICAILMVVSYGFAQNWKQTSPISSEGIACSADGKLVIAVRSTAQPLISTDSGNTWKTDTAAPYAYGCVASSADGIKLVGPFFGGNNFYLYISDDSGKTWTQTSGGADWRAVASSADGTKLLAAGYNTTIWLSTNSGSSWQTSSAPSKIWTSLASSADGTKLIGSGSGQIYISTNSGNNWMLSPVGGYSVATSADGRVLLVTGSSSTYISINFGSSWTMNAINGISVAASADGKRLIVGGLTPIYTSDDSGTTWVTNNAPSGWSRFASSADGCRLFAARFEGQGIWVGQLTPSPQLNLTASNTDLVFSWLVPSTNFVLQRSPDLISWSSVTDASVLNLTNLNNELALSPSNSSGFFRLISQ
jgi:photosystem II stability/assembly factor-like uncharacterized protein